MLVKKLKYIVYLSNNYSNWIYVVICKLFHYPIKKIILKNGITIVGSDKSLVLDIVDEIFVREVYTPSGLNINKGDIVVDIGANIGIFSLYARLRGAKHIYSVEPLKKNLKYIRKNFFLNKLKPPVLIDVAMSDKDGLLKLYLHDYDSHNMLFSIGISPNLKYDLVSGMKFSSFIKRYNLERIDFLKIDCEGAEGFIFKNSNKNDWKNIFKVSIEYHDNVSILNSSEIINKLSEYGFKTKIVKSDAIYGYIYAWRRV